MENCKLCLEQKPLIKTSHIIPKFMYRGMFDENEPLIIQPLSASRETERWEKKKSQEGEYEGGILCSDCEQFLSKNYEDYATKVIYGGNNVATREAITCKDFRTTDGHPMQLIGNVDYQRFKIFLLSILWRSSISTRDFFSDVNIDDHHVENLRKMIFDKNPGLVTDYPIFFATYPNDFHLPRKITGQPITLENNGVKSVLFLINGYFFWMYIDTDEDKVSKTIIENTIRPSNEFNLFHYSTESLNKLLSVLMA